MIRKTLCTIGAMGLLVPIAYASGLSVTNTAAIQINDSTNPPTLASQYPSPINVTGLAGQSITKVTVTLHGLSHHFTDDIDMLLVGPQGQKALIMSNVGGSTPGYSATNITLTLDDDAANSLPLEAPLVSGIFKPTKRLPYLAFDFPAPALAGSSNSPSALSVFQNTEPNGVWSLYIVDDAAPDAGVLSGGWTLSLVTAPVLLTIIPAGPNVVISWSNTAVGYTLQTTPSLSQTAVWTSTMASPAVVAGRYTLTNSAFGPARFYRLAR